MARRKSTLVRVAGKITPAALARLDSEIERQECESACQITYGQIINKLVMDHLLDPVKGEGSAPKKKPAARARKAPKVSIETIPAA